MVHHLENYWQNSINQIETCWAFHEVATLFLLPLLCKISSPFLPFCVCNCLLRFLVSSATWISIFVKKWTHFTQCAIGGIACSVTEISQFLANLEYEKCRKYMSWTSVALSCVFHYVFRFIYSYLSAIEGTQSTVQSTGLSSYLAMKLTR